MAEVQAEKIAEGDYHRIGRGGRVQRPSRTRDVLGWTASVRQAKMSVAGCAGSHQRTVLQNREFSSI